MRSTGAIVSCRARCQRTRQPDPTQGACGASGDGCGASQPQPGAAAERRLCAANAPTILGLLSATRRKVGRLLEPPFSQHVKSVGNGRDWLHSPVYCGSSLRSGCALSSAVPSRRLHSLPAEILAACPSSLTSAAPEVHPSHSSSRGARRGSLRTCVRVGKEKKPHVSPCRIRLASAPGDGQQID